MQAVTAIEGFDLVAERGEFVTFFGPNGCGKTTLLNCIAGVIRPDHGRILIDGKPPEGAKIGYVFQHYRASLFPWRTVIDNVALPLELRGLRRKDRRERAAEHMRRAGVDLPPLKYPYQLSGGQQQMVAILRGLIDEPDLLILDEPFSALDFTARIAAQDFVVQLWVQMSPTILFVSHEIDEAVYLADRLCVLRSAPGRVKHIADVGAIFTRPRSHRVLETEEFFAIRARVLACLSEP